MRDAKSSTSIYSLYFPALILEKSEEGKMLRGMWGEMERSGWLIEERFSGCISDWEVNGVNGSSAISKRIIDADIHDLLRMFGLW